MKNIKNDNSPTISKNITNESKLYEQRLTSRVTQTAKVVFQLVKCCIIIRILRFAIKQVDPELI